VHLESITLKPESYPTREHYPFKLPLFQLTRKVELRSRVTFFVGENGSGKSTLLEAITLASGIHIWRGLERTRCTSNPYEEKLSQFMEVAWTRAPVPGAHFSSQIFRNFAQLVDEWAAADPGLLAYFGNASLLTQSHGQSIMSFFRSRLALEGIYFLDEPETALSPRTQLEFLSLLEEAAARGNAQFIIATHSPILLSCRDAAIYSFDAAPLRELPYRETEHYRVYREFFESRA
jgi:predicted ATPase